jgi:DNA-binding transcriptional LysR family regulator
MELRQIRSFLSVAETLHFGRSAELIHLSQPALSLQIRGLEEEVGVRLFERNRRKTTLTAAGLAFRDDAAAALSQLEQAIRRARLAANGKLGLLRIGFISTAGSELVADIVRQFRELYPEVEFSLRNILTAEQVRMLETGGLDIGFLRLPIGGHSGLDVVTVHREPFVLVVPSSHKLAKRKTFAIYAGAVICFGGLIFAGIRMLSGRFQDAIPGLFGALFGAGVLGWGAGWIGSLTGQNM